MMQPRTSRTVLFVDDEPQVTSGIRRALRKEPFRILTAQSGAEALEILTQERVDLIVSDEVMPKMSGSELLSQVSRQFPEVVRIILTGQASLEATVRAINEGRIFRFLFKPCSDTQLLEVIQQGLQEKERREVHTGLILRAGRIASWEWNVLCDDFQCSDNMRSFLGIQGDESLDSIQNMTLHLAPHDRQLLQTALEHAVATGHGFDLEHRIRESNGADRWISHTADVLLDQSGKTVRMVGVLKDITDKKHDEETLRHSLESLSAALRSTVHALGVTAEKRDPYTAGHQERATRLACAIAQEMGLEQERIEGLHAAGLLHDIGKISVPAELLVKPSILSEFEMAIMKTHPTVGFEILKEIPFPWPVAQIVVQHHERMDVSGYPAGLRGEDILLEARILAVADVVEAMASHRPYRASLGMDKALQEVRSNAGRLYDQTVVDSLLYLRPRLEQIIQGQDA